MEVHPKSISSLHSQHVNAQYRQQSHNAILNILDKDTKIVFAHSFLEHTKKSEIPAFEGLLKDNFFDALLTQSEILNTINSQGSYYIAKVKGNQKFFKTGIAIGCFTTLYFRIFNL